MKRNRALRIFAIGLGGLTLAVCLYVYSYSFDAAVFDPDRGGPLVVTDRHGTVLRRVPSGDGRPGRERWVALSDVSSHAILTLLASEDQRFYEHAGVDPYALARALWLTLTTDRTYGGSTITLQLARMTHSYGERTLVAKLLEVRAALGIERNLEKDQILEQYLNRAYYGHGAYGIEAAAQRYFGRSARSLSVGESTYLAVLPRGPAYYDPVRHPERVLARRRHLFALLVQQGRLSEDEARRAAAQPITVELQPLPHHAPHFVDWIVAELPRSISEGGGVVTTTLDLPLQRALEHRTRDHVASQVRWDVEQAGAVVLDAQRAEVLAMVGSRDYADSQINIVTRRRFPGSALKPFVYATAIEGGASSASIAYDVREISPHYEDFGPERGPVSFRDALGGSLNYAAVHTIERTGIERVMERLRHAGVSELAMDPSDYGPRLALGSTRVRLLDLTAAYRFTVHDGRVIGPSGVLEVTRGERIVWRPVPREREVFSPETSWMVMDMLADADARRSTFGNDLPVDLAYPVVAKTGTSEGMSDTVAIFATREYLVGAWTGRFDGRSTRGLYGMTGAAPLARAALLRAADGRPWTLPQPPASLEEHAVCGLSGLRPGPHCEHVRYARFAPHTVPQRTCDWHRPDRIEWPAEVQAWARRTGQLGPLTN